MSAAPTTPFSQTLLARAHSPKTAESHYTDRVSKRPLPIRATSPTPSARAQRRRTLNARLEKQRIRTKLKPRPLSAAKKRALGLNEIAQNQQKYCIYQGLHELWCGYMREILGVSARKKPYITAAQVGQILASADMHGALVEVTRSRCVSRVGIKGIVVRDTKHTFEIITGKNKLKVVPKEHSVFRFEVPVMDPGEEGEKNREGELSRDGTNPLVFEFFGEQIQVRGAERANRKFRLHYQPDL